MEELWMPALMLVPMVLFLGGAFAWGAHKKKLFEAAFRQVAEANGLRMVSSTWWKGAYLRGAIDGVDLCLDTYVVSNGKSSTTHTRVRTRHPELPTTLRIVPEGVLQTFGKALGVQEDVRVGDPRLDEVATIRGEPDARVVARMSPGARRAVAAAVSAGAKLEDGAWTLIEHGLVTDSARLQELLRLAVDASRALIDSDPSPEALRARAEEEDDPEPSVRWRAFELAVRDGAPDEWLARMAEGHSPRWVVVAARARGEAGRERLWWVVDRGRGPYDREAAVALAALAPDARRAELEAALLRALGDGPEVEVVDALGRIASVRAVGPLQALQGPLGMGAVSSRARDAIRAIQSRSHGVAGGLAIAEVSGGELAEAGEKSRLGRLSQARATEG